MSETKQLLVGLPGTGKSTFLAALWYTAECGSTHWKIEQLGDEEEHLEMISQRWLECNMMQRSAQAGEALVSMRFREEGSERTLTAFFPDLAGETFEDQWVHRRCSKMYLETARASNQILMFLHPERLRHGDRIEDYLQEEPDDGEEERTAVERRPERDPTQVILVDLLQILSQPPILHESLRIAVVVSAWDLIEKVQTKGGVSKENPNTWFEEHLPLLHQFLKNNHDWIQFKVFGVSAQGGDYADQQEVSNLRSIAPEDRVRVVEEAKTTNDLTAPMSWLANV